MHQSQSPLVLFGSSTERMRRALDAVRAGQGVCIVDDEDRENEGDQLCCVLISGTTESP